MMPQPRILTRRTPYFLCLLLTCYLAFDSLSYSNAITINRLSPTSGSSVGGYFIDLQVTFSSTDLNHITQIIDSSSKSVNTTTAVPVQCVFAPETGFTVDSMGQIFVRVNDATSASATFAPNASASCLVPPFSYYTSEPVVVFLVSSLDHPPIVPPSFIDCSPPSTPCPPFEFFYIYPGDQPRTADSLSSMVWRVLIAGLTAFVCIFLLSRLIRYRMRALAAERAFLAANLGAAAIQIPQRYAGWAHSLPESHEVQHCVTVVQPNGEEYPVLGIQIKEVKSIAEEDEEDEEVEEVEKKESASPPLGNR